MSAGAMLAAAQADIGLWGLAASGLLIAVTVTVSLVRHLGIATDIVFTAARALVQLALVGLALQLVVDENDPLIWSWLWIAVMLAFAAWTVGRRAPELRRVEPLAFAAFLLATVASLGVLLGFGAFEPTGQAIVPLAGIVVGNSLSTTILAARRTVAEASEQRAQIEARLALGLSTAEAFAPNLQTTLKTALIPHIERTKAVGIVALPGAMTGLILAGVDPMDAVLVQVAVMYLVLGSVAITTTVMSIGLSHRLFNDAGQLVEI